MKKNWLLLVIVAAVVHPNGIACSQDDKDVNENKADSETLKKLEEQLAQQMLLQYYVPHAVQQNDQVNLNGVYQAYWQALQLQQSKPKYWIGVQCEPAGNVPILADIPIVGELYHHGGLKVTSVVKNSPANKAGLIKGDVIASINNSAINNLAELSTALEKAKNKPSKVTIIRDKKTMVVDVVGQQRSEAKSDNSHPQFQAAWQDYWHLKDADKYREATAKYWLQAIAHNIQLPEDVEITFKKKGNQPASVVVSQKNSKWTLVCGGKGWEVRKTDGRKLPSEVKLYLDSTIRKSSQMRYMPYTAQLQWKPSVVQWYAPVQAQQKEQNQLDQLMERIEKMSKDLEELKKSARQINRSDR